MAVRRLSDAEVLQQPAARKRGHRARAVRYDQAKGRVVLELSSGVLFELELAPLRWSLHLCVRGGVPDAPSSRCLPVDLS